MKCMGNGSSVTCRSTKYVARHREIANAMWAVDPKIQLVGVGAVGEWSRTMLEQVASHMTFISEHDYWHGDPDVVKHIEQAPEGIRRIAEAHRAYVASCRFSRKERAHRLRRVELLVRFLRVW